METKVPCSLLLPCAMISFSLYQPLSEQEMEMWDSHDLSIPKSSSWVIAEFIAEVLECGAETAPIIIII